MTRSAAKVASREKRLRFTAQRQGGFADVLTDSASPRTKISSQILLPVATALATPSLSTVSSTRALLGGDGRRGLAAEGRTGETGAQIVKGGTGA